MELAGEALCHLCSLYKVEDPYNCGLTNQGGEGNIWNCHLTFDRLGWRIGQERMDAHFQADGIPKFNTEKEPLGRVGQAFLAQGGTSLWGSYQMALKQGTSDAELV
jgi:hypothetical protein